MTLSDAMPRSGGRPFSQALTGRLEATVERFAVGAPGRGQPGVAWGVVRGGVLVASGGAGTLRVGTAGAPDGPRPDADSVFRIASMTKSFTAAALVALRDAGRIGLDEPVARYVPELEGLAPPTADSPVLTVRHLLTMSGGLPTDDPWGDRQQGLDLDAFGDLLRAGLTFAWVPGTTFEYCNLGYAVLGRAIANVTGEDYADAVRRLVLDPLGLTSTVYRPEEVDAGRLAAGHRPAPGVGPLVTAERDVPGTRGGAATGWEHVPYDPYGAFAPMGGLFSSVRDLCRWVAGLADAFPPRDDAEDGHPLSRASRREMQQQHRAMPVRVSSPSLDQPAWIRGGGYGFGLMVDHDPRWGAFVMHSGGYPGFGSHMRWHPDSGTGVVVLANSTYAATTPVATRMLLDVLDEASDAGERAAVGAVGAVVRTALRPAAPAPGTPWPATLAAMSAVEGLLRDWDEDVAARLLAGNVDLDEPLAVRAARARQAAVLAGDDVLVRDPSAPPVHESPAHARWWLRGGLGRVLLEVRLTGHPEPLVQTLTVTPVPAPLPGLATALDLVVDEMAAPLPGWPRLLAVAPGLDLDAAVRQLRLAAAYAGPVVLGPVVASDGACFAVARLLGARATLELTLEVDASGMVRRLQVGLPEQTGP